MQMMTKIALVSASVLSMGVLSACQSTNTAKENESSHSMKKHHAEHQMKMTPEQREQRQQMHAERKKIYAQIKQACEHKSAGQSVQIKAGEKTIAGTCAMTFKPDQQAAKNMRAEQRDMKAQHRPMRGEINGMHMKGAEPLTDARRAELTQEFSQRLAERQAKQQAMAKACQGKTSGQAVQIKMGEHSINGQCQLRFQPQTAIANS